MNNAGEAEAINQQLAPRRPPAQGSASAQVDTNGNQVRDGSGSGAIPPRIRTLGLPSGAQVAPSQVRGPSSISVITLDHAPDLTQPLSSAGDSGATARSAGRGRGAYLSHYTVDGTHHEVVVKIPPNHIFAQELVGALAADSTGFGPHVFGTAIVNGNRGIVMGRQPGGFISTTSHNASHIQEAEHFSGRITENTITELNQYRDRLLQNNYMSGGDFQFFVDEQGHMRPIDFSVILPLPADHNARQQGIQNHMATFASEEQVLRGRLNENQRRGRYTP